MPAKALSNKKAKSQYASQSKLGGKELLYSLLMLGGFAVFSGSYGVYLNRDPYLVASILERNNNKAGLFLILGASANARGTSGKTALVAAIETRNTRIGGTLIKKGADLNRVDANGITPLISAIARDDLPMVNWLLARKASLNARGANETTPLTYAIENGKRQLAEVLLDAGADIDALSSDNRSALMAAVKMNNSDLARLLLARGANRELVNERGQSALTIAVAEERLDLIDLLLDSGASSAYLDQQVAEIATRFQEGIAQQGKGFEVEQASQELTTPVLAHYIRRRFPKRAQLIFDLAESIKNTYRTNVERSSEIKARISAIEGRLWVDRAEVSRLEAKYPSVHCYIRRRFDTHSTGRGIYEAFDTNTFRKMIVIAFENEIEQYPAECALKLEYLGEQAADVTVSNAFHSYQKREYYPTYITTSTSSDLDTIRRRVASDEIELQELNNQLPKADIDQQGAIHRLRRLNSLISR